MKKFVFLFLFLAVVGITSAQTVVVQRGNGLPEIFSGLVESVSGQKGLVFRDSTGDRFEFAISDVLSINIAEGEQEERATKVFGQAVQTGNSATWQEALACYLQLRKPEETPVWLRMWYTAKIVRCYTALDDELRAAEEFFLLCQIDPHTPFLEVIPLRWLSTSQFRDSSQQGSLESLARRWIANDSPGNHLTNSPAAQLLVASVLLESAQGRREAQEVLESLLVLRNRSENSPNLDDHFRTISILAMTQLWRQKLLLEVRPAELNNWATVITKLPTDLRGGPLYLLGRGWLKAGETTNALESFLKVTLLYQGAGKISHDSRHKAIDILNKSGREKEGQRLAGPNK